MFDQPEDILRSTKGSLAETPLEQLFEAILETQRTCGLELKRQGFEKVIAFERGVPVGCTSNLVEESIGRVLVDKKLLGEKDYQTLLNASAERSLSFETALAQSKLLDPQSLEKLLHANLALKILDCFRWIDARYCLMPEVAIDPGAPRMNPGQLLFTAVCTALPYEKVSDRFSLPSGQRWAKPHRPRHGADELKLSPKDGKVLEALSARPTFGELCQTLDQDPEAVARRLYALALLGLAEHSEKVPEQPREEPRAVPVAELPPPPKARRASVTLGAAAVLAAVAAGGLYLSLRSAPAPAQTSLPPLVLKAARTRPAGARVALDPVPPLLVAPAGARPRPDEPRGLWLSASGIALEPPAPNRRTLDAANHLLEAGRPEAALPLYERAMRASPKDADAAFGAALAHYAAGQDEGARKNVERALELRADHAEAHLLLAFLEQLSARAPEAVAHYQRFVDLSPDSPRAQDVRALIEQLKL